MAHMRIWENGSSATVAAMFAGMEGEEPGHEEIRSFCITMVFESQKIFRNCAKK